jgi:hypothetical protein
MADVTQNVRIALSQTGAEEVGRKIAGVAKEQNTLKQFVREQRTEQRMQTFLFREAAGAALVLANALGNTSKEARQMTNALNAGFATFQGIDFVLGRALGPLGLVLGALAGVAAAMATVTNNSENMTKAIEEFSRRTESLDLAGKVGLRGRLGAAIGSRQEALQGIQGARLANVMGGTQRNIVDEAYEKQLKNEVAALEVMADNLGLSVEQAKQLNMALRIMAEVNLPAVNKAAGGGKDGYPLTSSPWNRFDMHPEAMQPYAFGFGNQPRDTRSMSARQLQGQRLQGIGNLQAVDMSPLKEFDAMNGVARDVGLTLESSLTTGIRNAAGAGEDILTQMLAAIGSRVGSNMVLYVLSKIPFFGSIFGGGGGGNPIQPDGSASPAVTGGETVMVRAGSRYVAARYAGDRIVSQRARLGT